MHTINAHFVNAIGPWCRVKGDAALHLLQGTNGNDLGPLCGWRLTGTNRASKDPVRDLSSQGPTEQPARGT